VSGSQGLDKGGSCRLHNCGLEEHQEVSKGF